MAFLLRMAIRRLRRWPVLFLLGVGGMLASVRAAAHEPVDIVILLDNSTSMLKLDNGQPGTDTQFMRLTAVQYLLEKLAPQDRIAVITFDTAVQAGKNRDPFASHLHSARELSLPDKRWAFEQGVSRIAGSPGGYTDMAAGLIAAATILEQESGKGRRRFLVFLTDGVPDTPYPARKALNTLPALKALAARIHREGIVIHTIGLGALAPTPSEAAQAHRLLDSLATEGKSQAAQSPEALPALFGVIFARLVGHEVSHIVAPGQQASFALAPGTHGLRVLATSAGQAPQITITRPGNQTLSTQTVGPLLPGKQTGWISAASVDQPAAGTWTVRADHGAVEIAWEPNFEVALVSPVSGATVPARAPVSLIARMIVQGGAPSTATRVQAEYPPDSGTTIAFTPDPRNPGQFTAVLPDSGAVGPHELVIRCFRQSDNGEEEGGPAYAVLQAARLPVAALTEPVSGASYTLPAAIPVRGRLSLPGERGSAPGSGLVVQASLAAPDGAHETTLTLTPDGSFAGRLSPGRKPGAGEVRVTLSGRFEGHALEPQMLVREITLTPHPEIALLWEAHPAQMVDPQGEATLTAHIHSSAGTAQTIHLVPTGMAGVTAAPDTLEAAPNLPDRAVPVRIRWQGEAPGDHALVLTPQLNAPGIDFVAAPYRTRLHVRSWLERNGWWFYPGLALLVLLILIGIGLTFWWIGEQARREQQIVQELRKVAIYVPYEPQPFRLRPDRISRAHSFTVGGEGADVTIPDPQRPGQMLFREPRLRVAARWNRRAGRPQVSVKAEGGDTMLFDRDSKMMPSEFTPEQGGTLFFVDPEHVLVRVQPLENV